MTDGFFASLQRVEAFGGKAVEDPTQDAQAPVGEEGGVEIETVHSVTHSVEVGGWVGGLMVNEGKQVGWAGG